MENNNQEVNPSEVEEAGKELQLMENELATKHIGRSLVEALTAPTPKDDIKWRKGRGGKEYPYCEGTYFIKKLNQSFGFLWGFTCSEGQVFEIGIDPITKRPKKQIVVKGEVEVVFPGRIVETKYEDGRIEKVSFDTIRIKKSQFGGSDVKVYEASNPGHYEKGDPMDMADDFKAAGTDAMKKAATQFGIALDVYGVREVGSKKDENKADDSQVQVFYFRAGKAGMNKEEADKWCMEQEKAMGRSPENCPGAVLMVLVPELMRIAKEKSK